MGKKKIKKYIGYFLQNLGGVPNIVGTKKLKFNKKDVSFKGKAFVVDFDNPIFEDGLDVYFFFDYSGSGQLLLNQGSEVALQTTEMMDIICDNEAILQLIRANEVKKSWTDLILGVICGVGVGISIGIMIPVGVIP